MDSEHENVSLPRRSNESWLNGPFTAASDANAYQGRVDNRGEILLDLEVMMKRLVTGTFVALAIASGPVFACAEPPAAHVAHAAEAKLKAARFEAKLKKAEPSVGANARMVHPVVEAKLKTAQPVAEAASKTADPAVEAKFEAVDEDNSGTLDGTEVEVYKPTMAQIDANKDGKISREEFAAAMKAGSIK
jgi:hypothetical protein